MARPHAKPNTSTTTLDAAPPNRAMRRLLAHEFTRLQPAITRSAAACGAEHYRKHFDSFAHACMLLFHGLSRGQSLRQSYAAFACCPGLVALSGLQSAHGTVNVSFSQLAASNTSRPAAFLAGVLPAFIARVRQRGVATGAMPPDLHILDATFLRVSLQLAGWLPPVSTARKSGVQVQLQYQPAYDLPEQVAVTTIRRNDVQRLDAMLLEQPDQLAALAGQTLLMDLGFYSHRRFADLLAANIHFVTRLHPQASVEVTADRPLQLPLDPTLPPGRITILADQEITLGSAHNRAGAVVDGLRVVTGVVQPNAAAARQQPDPCTYQVLTDRLDLSAEMVVQSYVWRWQIELFFRWLKSHLKLPRLLGYSQNAIELTIILALLVHLFCLLAAEVLAYARRSPVLLAQFPWAFAQLTLADADPALCAQQLPLPLPTSPP